MKKSGMISNPKYCTRISKIGERPSESPKVNTHHEPQSSEDSVSDYENELNKKMQPRRVSGCDTRNNVRSAKKIVQSSSSEVGKSAKEHLGKLVGGKAKKHQPVSSSKDSVSDYDESEQVLKIKPEKVYNTRSNAERREVGKEFAGFATKSEDEPSESPSDHIKGKGNTHHEPQSSEDDASDYENELNKKMQPRRVFGRDTRNKVRSSKKIVQTSSSAVGKSAKEHKGSDSHDHDDDYMLLLRGSLSHNIEIFHADLHKKIDSDFCLKNHEFYDLLGFHLDVLKTNVLKDMEKYQEMSSSEDSGSDYERELNQVLKIERRKFSDKDTRSKVQSPKVKKPVQKGEVKKSDSADDNIACLRAALLKGPDSSVDYLACLSATFPKEPDSSGDYMTRLQYALSYNAHKFYEDLYRIMEGRGGIKKPALDCLIDVVIVEFTENMLRDME